MKMNLNRAAASSVDQDYYFTIAAGYWDNLLSSNKNMTEIDLPAVELIEKRNKSISVIFWHSYFPVPTIQIELEIFSVEREIIIANYLLLIDENDQFVDEFLISK